MEKDTSRQQMLRETTILSLVSVSLQGLGLLLNIYLTRMLGTVAVGILALMGSFCSLAMVLSGGSGFIGTSRFLSEELGCNGNPKKVFRYALRFCMTLSGTACVLLFCFAPWLTQWISDTGASALTIRLLSLTLPIAALSACCKGRCYAHHRVYIPAFAECIEFLLRAGVMASCSAFFIPSGRISLLTAFALSMLVGQTVSTLFLLCAKMPQCEETGHCSIGFSRFVRCMLPIMGNACLVSLLGSLNDALVPLTLLQYGDSTDEALSQFGEFEAIIIPALFFPSVIQCCMSGLLVPTLSRARSANDQTEIRATTQHVLEQTMGFSLFVVLIFRLFSQTISHLLGSDTFAGDILHLMAPIIPFIYLEIILEGVLRGLGQQNLSSVNYLAEYLVRISVLLICVPLFGFYGIVASYIACNLTGNAVRLYFVLKLTGLHPNWKRILLRPAFSLLIAWQVTNLLLLWLRKGNDLLYMTVFCLVCGALEWYLLRVLEHLSERQTKLVPNV